MTISSLSLFKRSNGKWYILYTEEGRPRWKSTGASLKQDALKVLSEFREHLKHRAPALLFTEFKTQFKTAQAANLRKSTLERIYSPAFDAFLSVCGNKALSAYTVKDVEAFKRTMLNGRSATYVNILFRSLRAAFNLAVKWQLLNENPFAKASSVNVPERSPIYLTKEQFKALISKTKEPVLRDVFTFAVLTGMRQGEILNLTWQSVDLQGRLVRAESAGRFLTKTGKLRSIPLSDIALEILKRRKLMSKVCPYVFHKKGFQLNQSYVEHKFKKYVKAAELDLGLRFHSLRHSYASWLVKDGVNIYWVQKLLGHTSVRMTEQYSHLAASELQEAVSKIDDSLN
jgi:integrase